ncbi:hypothetical protein COLINT_02494 [Collinsella intestinalis DSM 13280]|uniref:Uncharacterized protein n=1 Tax=Collinsella intestinalis DSM 13280 TaxID=521003 RepID=C4F8W8_9ACTN|nr:hypothetical protein COLINT_02494 [Collinsella intestinalis DSM 13280]
MRNLHNEREVCAPRRGMQRADHIIRPSCACASGLTSTFDR